MRRSRPARTPASCSRPVRARSSDSSLSICPPPSSRSYSACETLGVLRQRDQRIHRRRRRLDHERCRSLPRAVDVFELARCQLGGRDRRVLPRFRRSGSSVSASSVSTSSGWRRARDSSGDSARTVRVVPRRPRSSAPAPRWRALCRPACARTDRRARRACSDWCVRRLRTLRGAARAPARDRDDRWPRSGGRLELFERRLEAGVELGEHAHQIGDRLCGPAEAARAAAGALEQQVACFSRSVSIAARRPRMCASCSASSRAQRVRCSAAQRFASS